MAAVSGRVCVCARAHVCVYLCVCAFAFVCLCVCVFLYTSGDINLNTHRLMGTCVTVGT